MTVLVTGAAGFIGYHTAEALLARGEQVVGIDDLNAYYDPQLKADRLALLTANPNYRHARIDLEARRLDHRGADHRPDRDAHRHHHIGAHHGREPGGDVLVLGHELGAGSQRPVAGDRHIARLADRDRAGIALELDVARAGAGTNNIPVKLCTERGIVVFNTPGANAEAVKELVICALLMASRDVIGGIEWVHSIGDKGDEIAGMVEKGKSSFVGPEIAGKTLGVVGLGAIGAKIANTALELGMKVYGYDPFLSVDAAWKLSSQVKHATDIDTIYRNCDYITLHVP